MKLDELVPRLQANHHHDQQACLTISAAVAEVEHGLTLLARLGHVYHLEPGPPFHLPEWPRILFHVENAPNGRVVNSYWEAADLGPGWWPTLSEAQRREGVRAQFAGRGGIGDRSLPMLVDGGPAGPRPDRPRQPADNGKLIEEWRKSIEPIRESGEGHWGQTNILASGTEADDRNGSGSVPTTPQIGPGISGEPFLGNQRLSEFGTENRVPTPGAPGPQGVPENAVPGEGLSDRGDRAARAAADLRRILESSANTLSASRASRAAGRTDPNSATPDPTSGN